jgi:pantetheine-phosphate adenylyltransferase
MYTIGMVTGSFDPITRGHEWMVERACRTFDEVYFAIAYNPAKKGMFNSIEREELARRVLADSLTSELFEKLKFVVIENEFTVSVAKRLGVTTIMRGIRNAVDFGYEKDIQGFNTDIENSIDHVFVIPPEDITRISSSAVRGFVGINNWEEKVAKYIHPFVLQALADRANV